MSRPKRISNRAKRALNETRRRHERLSKPKADNLPLYCLPPKEDDSWGECLLGIAVVLLVPVLFVLTSLIFGA